MPPYGTNPPRGPVATVPQEYGSRLIRNDPRELWYLALPSKLTPKQVLQILRSALGGDVWQQWQLASLMLDSWPMLRKCTHELRQSVAGTRYVVRPAVAKKGQPATPKALERAELVERAMANFEPNPFAEEEAWYGMIYDITGSMLDGIDLLELVWHEKGGELLPRAACWVHPRHFTFTNAGEVAVFDAHYQRLLFGPAGKGESPDPDKFMCVKYKSRSGSSLGAGLIRPLAWYWSSVVFCREWTLQTAQKHGSPFLDATYKPGVSEAEVEKLKGFVSQAAAEGWVVHVEGTDIKVVPAQSLGTDNPQRNAVAEADKACQIIFLGQSGTTEATPGKLGNDDTHKDVKRENAEALARWVGEQLTQQFAKAVLRLNYGDTEDCPTIEPDSTEEKDPQVQASVAAVYLSAGVPMLAEEFYREAELKQPKEGDLVIVGGKLGRLKGSEEDLGGQPVVPPGFAPGAPEEDQEKEPEELEDGEVEAALAGLGYDELAELKALAMEAAKAPSLNGEWDRVKARLAEMKGRL